MGATESEVLVEDRDGICIVTLNRPDKLNACTDATYDALRACFVAAATRPETKCLVLTGAGRAFCAGQDMDEMNAPPTWNDGTRHGFVPCIEEIERFPKPLIAAVNGLAIGFGTTVLLHCDLVIASEAARFRLPFSELGLAPEAGSSVTLPMRVGEQEAANLLFTAEWLDAEQAETIGLVWRRVPNDGVVSTSLEVARQIGTMPLSSLVATKKLLLAGRLDAVRAGRERELDAYARLLVSAAHKDAVSAFLAQRGAGR